MRYSRLQYRLSVQEGITYTVLNPQSNGRMMSLPRTSVAKLLGIPAFQFGTSNVVVWHQGLSPSSVSIVLANASDHPLRGKAVVTDSMNPGETKFARLKSGQNNCSGL